MSSGWVVGHDLHEAVTEAAAADRARVGAGGAAFATGAGAALGAGATGAGADAAGCWALNMFLTLSRGLLVAGLPVSVKTIQCSVRVSHIFRIPTEDGI